MWLEIDDELFPPRASLVGLHFATDEEFRRGVALLWQEPDRYGEVYDGSRILAVRKADVPVFEAAGLNWTEVALTDWEALSEDEANRRVRAIIQEEFPKFIERLRQRP